MRLRCVGILLIMLSGHLPAAAQKEGGARQPKRDELLEKKALVALDETVRESHSLKLPENRVRIQVTAADLLWRYDERRARALFNEAKDVLAEVVGGLNEEDPGYEYRQQVLLQLRQQSLQIISRRDLNLAREFLRATRQPSSSLTDGYYRQRDMEAQLEVMLASQLAATDPKQSLKLAEESLEREISYELPNLLYQLQQSDRDSAAKLLAAMMKRFREESFSD